MKIKNESSPFFKIEQMIIIVIFVAIVFIIIKIYSPKIKGFIGEAKVNTRLNFLGKEYIVLKDILISSSNYNKPEKWTKNS